MTGNTCKTCRWWSGKEITYYEPSQNKMIRSGRRTCESPACMGPQDAAGDCLKQLDPSHVECMDASGYWAGIAPGPNFGCIHHLPLETMGKAD
jgi:hypothetical protein